MNKKELDLTLKHIEELKEIKNQLLEDNKDYDKTCDDMLEEYPELKDNPLISAFMSAIKERDEIQKVDLTIHNNYEEILNKIKEELENE